MAAMTATDAATPARKSENEALDALIERFHAGKRLRVWSLVITAFGDAIIPRGGMLGMAALQELTDRIGVTPGALRAAVSRLAKDGWVERHRHGRKSYYSLSPASAATSIEAGKRFYAPGPPEWDGTWTVALAPEESAPDRESRNAALNGIGFIRLGNGAYVRPSEMKGKDIRGLTGMFVLQARADTIPVWVLRLGSDPDIALAYEAIIAAFAPLDAALASGETLSPLDAFVARTLLIHDWRRVVLRDIELPEELRPQDWPSELARNLVKRLYARLLAPSERWLDTCDGRPDKPLPKADASLHERFTSALKT
mgnify:CR=1 FL=1